MPLDTRKTYFVAASHCYLLANPGSGDKINHLLMGDWLRYLGPTEGEWVRVHCRGDTGWLSEDQVTDSRALEVNFIDIGQGDGCHIVTPEDNVVLIDAGVGSNMNRFLNWRYNLRSRNVRRAPDFDEGETERAPWKIDHVVISHPDNDHYYGFMDVFENPKLQFETIWHNGIVERPRETAVQGLRYYSRDDLGGYAERNGQRFVWDLRLDDAGMKAMLAAHPSTRKQLISTYREAVANSPEVAFSALGRPAADIGAPVHMGPFDGSGSLRFEVLGPLREQVTFGGETRETLRRLGDEGITKNGHSVFLRLEYRNLRVMLGGDLNTEAQDFLLQRYSGRSEEASKLEHLIGALQAKGPLRTPQEEMELNEAEAALDAMVTAVRGVFQVDVAKACHHGSAHFTSAFLRAMNPLATVISSGDEESYAHPRPDALGAFGKHGRGDRPLIFSTELARSTREFTPIFVYFQELQYFLARIAAAESPAEKARIQRQMEMAKDRNVAVYGMITLRALGDRVVMAQKLEQPGRDGTKWDIHQLDWNAALGEYQRVAD